MKKVIPKNTSKNSKKIERRNAEDAQTICSQDTAINRLIAENMYDTLYMLDTEGHFIFVNDIALERTTYTREHFIGKSFLDFVRLEERAIVQKSFDVVMKGKSVPPYELSHLNASGKPLWEEINVTPLDDKGRIIGMLVISRDITERKRIEEELKLYRDNLEVLIESRAAELRMANEHLQSEINEHKKTEEALRSSEAYYRTIFQNTGTAMVIMEEDTTISLTNTESEKFVGYRPSDLEDKRKAIDFVARDDLKRIMGYQQMRKVDPDKGPRSYDLKIVDRLGNVRDVHITIALIPDTRKTIASFIDITEQKKMEAALKSRSKISEHFPQRNGRYFSDRYTGRDLKRKSFVCSFFWYKSPEDIMEGSQRHPL